jgi:hypothetical protein
VTGNVEKKTGDKKQRFDYLAGVGTLSCEFYQSSCPHNLAFYTPRAKEGTSRPAVLAANIVQCLIHAGTSRQSFENVTELNKYVLRHMT